MKTKINSFGISKRSFTQIHEVLKLFEEVEKVIIFGSRAMQNEKKRSDIDLVVYGKNIDNRILRKIKILLNEKHNIPYFIDVLDYKNIKSLELIEHINNEGKVFYRKNCEIN